MIFFLELLWNYHVYFCFCHEDLLSRAMEVNVAYPRCCGGCCRGERRSAPSRLRSALSYITNYSSRARDMSRFTHFTLRLVEVLKLRPQATNHPRIKCRLNNSWNWRVSKISYFSSPNVHIHIHILNSEKRLDDVAPPNLICNPIWLPTLEFVWC